MKLDSCKQIAFSEINIAEIDAVICASGYESRCIYLAQVLKHSDARKYALVFQNNSNEKSRIINNKVFSNLGYKLFPAYGDDFESVKAVLDEINLNISKKTVHILVDYSSMTRVWYAYILLYFSHLNQTDSEINLIFLYSFSKFLPASNKETFNKFVGPIFGFCQFSIPDKPTALIVGLGYEKNRAFGLTEYLDAETYLFYTEPEEFNAKFISEVESQNVDLISDVKKENIYKYPISNLDSTINLLYTLCSDLQPDHRIVLAPCGPKPFTLASLITSLKLDFIDVWRVSAGVDSNIYDREATGKFSIMKCKFNRQ